MEEIDREEQREESASRGFVVGAGTTAGVIVLFLFLRILAVSNWNWEVAAEIAESFDFDDAVPIVFGTLFERPGLTGAVVTIIFPLALFRLFILGWNGRLSRSLTDVLVLISLGATQVVLVRTFGQWWTVIVPTAIAIFLIVFYLVLYKREKLQWMNQIGKHIGTVLVVAVICLAVTVQTPWSPKETIETDSGTIKGYVLEATPGFVRVLTTDREVVILNDSEVKRRTPGHE